MDFVLNKLSYAVEDGAVAINVIIDSENDTMWTTQKTMVELFGKNIKTISKHLTNIFESEELVKSEVTFNPNDSTNSGIVIINLIRKHSQYYTTWMPLSLLAIV